MTLCDDEWQNIRTICTRNFAVVLEYQDESFPDTTDFDEETKAGIARRDYGVYAFRVAVYWHGCSGIVGESTISNSTYSDPEEFGSEHYGNPGRSYFADLVRSAVLDARATLRNVPYIRPQQ